ncbi:hypothetical protein Avbf_10952 [Armadillidium vulgare]|nr:hypothetical protein Avbf_10952 [Armadillidium vulgare]
MEMNIHYSKWPIDVSLHGYDIGVVVSFGHLIPENIIKSFPLYISIVRAAKLDFVTVYVAVKEEPDDSLHGDEILAPKVKQEFSEILWDAMSPRIISLMFRALDDYHPLWSSWHGKNVQLLDLFSVSIDRDCTEDLIEELTKYEFIKKLKKMNVKRKRETLEKEIEFHKRSHAVAGQIIYIKQNGVLRVKCLNGFVDFKSIKVTGKKKMSALDFYNGFMSKVPYTKHYFY